ncbi:hypothetical protein [Burkholderia anthina]|uniref:hypothetical protein n=1 Tax=Burkholderia anthina TaxID=179879 RepID=UPI00158CAFA0|nr:hypothetical protein [Burkholderia anthina]
MAQAIRCTPFANEQTNTRGDARRADLERCRVPSSLTAAVRLQRPMVFPAPALARWPGSHPTPAPRAFRSLSAQERMLEASAIIEPHEFADHVSDDRRSPRIRPFTGRTRSAVASRDRACHAGRERPGTAPRHIDNQETR